MIDSVQPMLALGKPHHNQYLFSDHYLENILGSDRAFWDEARPEGEAFLVWQRDLYAQERGQLAAYSESQLEDRSLRPDRGGDRHRGGARG